MVIVIHNFFRNAHRLVTGVESLICISFGPCVIMGALNENETYCTPSNLAGTDTRRAAGAACEVGHFAHSYILVSSVPQSLYSSISTQVSVWLSERNKMVMHRGATTSCQSASDCWGLRGAKKSTYWEQCCTSGDLCNNIAIPAGVSSLAALEQCYLGMTKAECMGTLSPGYYI